MAGLLKTAKPVGVNRLRASGNDGPQGSDRKIFGHTAYSYYETSPKDLHL
jgi:hypothetical protein